MQHPMGCESTLAIDVLAALYNIIACHSKNAGSAEDLKIRG